MYYNAVFKADFFECLYLSKFNSNNWAWFLCYCFRISTLQKSSSLSSLRKEASDVVGLVSYFLPSPCIWVWHLCCDPLGVVLPSEKFWVRAPCGMCWQWSHTCDIFHILLKKKSWPWKHRCFSFPLCMRLLPETLLLCFCPENEVGFFYWICLSDLREEKNNSHHHFLPVFKVNNFGRPCN